MGIAKSAINTLIVCLVAVGAIFYVIGIDVSFFASVEEKKKEEIQIESTAADLLALSLEIWQGSGHGESSRLVKQLIGIAAIQFSRKKGKNLSTVFGKGLILLPEKVAREDVNTKWLPLRSVSMVSFKANLSDTFSESREIAMELLEARGTPYNVLLLPEEEKAKLSCVIAFTRAHSGLLDLRLPFSFSELKKKMKYEYGEPVYSDPDGAEFFCAK